MCGEFSNLTPFSQEAEAIISLYNYKYSKRSICCINMGECSTPS